MHRGMKKTHSLTVRRYVAYLIGINEYLASFPGDNLTYTIRVTKLNEILLNSMSNSWSKQAYVQGFDCASINCDKAVNMFEHI